MSIRQCYVCDLPVPGDMTSCHWEVRKNFDGSAQYRCPKHRVGAPKQLATLGESRKIKLNSLYGRFGK